jgi:hypothetical protein
VENNEAYLAFTVQMMGRRYDNAILNGRAHLFLDDEGSASSNIDLSSRYLTQPFNRGTDNQIICALNPNNDSPQYMSTSAQRLHFFPITAPYPFNVVYETEAIRSILHFLHDQ